MKTALYSLLITFALLIDGLQALVAWGFLAIGTGLQALTPLGGGVAGAAGGAYACWNATTGVFSATIAAGKCAVGGALVGAVASAFGVPIGVALGVVFDICISLTFGAGLIVILMFTGMYYQTRIVGNLIIELIPGLDVIPSWTLMVILCIFKKESEEGGVVGAVATVTTVAASIENPVSAINTIQEATRRMLPTTPPPQEEGGGAPAPERNRPALQDITQRAGNDNKRYVQKAA